MNFLTLSGILERIKQTTIMELIIKRILTYAVLPAAIVVLAYYNVMSLTAPLRFEESRLKREAVAIQRLKDIRTLQDAYKNVNGRYASTIDSLKLFYNEGVLPVVLQIGSKDDSLAMVNTEAVIAQLKKQKVAAKDMPKKLYERYLAGEKDLVFSIEHNMPIKDTLFNERSGFCIDSLAFIPFSGGDSIEMKAIVADVSGVTAPLFEAKMHYRQLLKGLDKQLVVNLIAERDSAERYAGLKVGDLERPNNNAGNWE